jgi:hypothetical protein
MACDKWIFLHTTVSLLFASTEERLGKQRNLGMNAPKLVGGKGSGELCPATRDFSLAHTTSEQSRRRVAENMRRHSKGRKREGPVAGRFRKMGK